MIALMVITDGRDHVFQAIPSALANLDGPITRKLIYYDDNDKDHATRLADTFSPLGFELIWGHRRGFGGAIDAGWTLLKSTDEQYIFHCEDDFIYNRPVDLGGMALALHAHPDLTQMCLRRQPWNDEERAAGGIVESHPDDYRDVSWWRYDWLEHRRCWSTNPCLYPKWVTRVPWPDCPDQSGWPNCEHSEGVFTHRLLGNPACRFAFWGSRDSGEWVTHIGDERIGTGY